MKRTADVVIIGAGIVGAACADAFSAEGLSAAIVEMDMVGSGATAAGMGHLVVMDDSEAEFALTKYSLDLWNELAPALPPDVEYSNCGTIWVAVGEEEFELVRRKHEFYSRRGVATEILDSRALAEAEPNLRSGLVGGLLVPGDGVIYSPCAAGWLVEQARSRGAELHLGVRATGLEDADVRLSDGTILSAGLVVNATGTWAPQLTPSLCVRPRKGHLAITDRYPGFVRHALIELAYLKSAHGAAEESVAFNVQPRPTGQALIGSSRQFGKEDFGIDYALLGKMLRRALEYMPGLADLSTVRTWTGFRAATDDKLPFIGPWPDSGRLYLATGHEGLGITTSLATARLLADHYTGRQTKIPIDPYLPARGQGGNHR